MSTVTIHGMDTAGHGVGRLADGRVVFVAGTLPGDCARVRLTEIRKKVQYAELLELVEPSGDRTASRCGVESCGGCPLRSLSAVGHASLKSQGVVDALRRIGGIDASGLVGKPIQAEEGWHYRHRVRFHADHDGNEWRLGFHARGTHDLVPLSRCPVLWPELESVALELAAAISGLSPRAKIREIDLVFSRRDARAAARIVADGPMAAFRDRPAWLESIGISGIEIACPEERFRWGNLELRYDHGAAEAFDLRYEPGIFTQAFPEINDRLVDLVVNAVRPTERPRVLELHAGIGNISIPLARAGARLTTCETHPRAVALAKRNAAGVEIDIRAMADEALLNEELGIGDVDVVVLDPPRSGARGSAELLAAAAESGKWSGRVVYVSCDPATLARDAKVLGHAGLTLSRISVLDMFPQTPHVESVALFE